MTNDKITKPSISIIEGTKTISFSKNGEHRTTTVSIKEESWLKQYQKAKKNVNQRQKRDLANPYVSRITKEAKFFIGYGALVLVLPTNENINFQSRAKDFFEKTKGTYLISADRYNSGHLALDTFAYTDYLIDETSMEEDSNIIPCAFLMKCSYNFIDCLQKSMQEISEENNDWMPQETPPELPLTLFPYYNNINTIDGILRRPGFIRLLSATPLERRDELSWKAKVSQPFPVRNVGEGRLQ